MNASAVLFDLDGTLLDTLADIAIAANAVLEEIGLPTHPVEAYRQFIGEGVPMLFQRAAGAADPALLDRCVGRFREVYGQAWNVRTHPYDGVPELLDELTARGPALAVLSNKPDVFTRLCVEHYLGRWPFRVVLGSREGVPRKPDPAGALEAAALLGLDPAAIVYLGDTAIDMRTARGAGMHPVGVSWGFRPVAELLDAGAAQIIDRPLALLDVLDGLA